MKRKYKNSTILLTTENVSAVLDHILFTVEPAISSAMLTISFDEVTPTTPIVITVIEAVTNSTSPSEKDQIRVDTSLTNVAEADETLSNIDFF